MWLLLFAQIIEQVLDPKGSGWFAREHRVVWSNGEVRWLSVRKQVCFDRSGESPKPTHGILVALDVTERKQAEETLEQANEELAATVQELQVTKEELLTQNENLEQAYKRVELERERYEDLFNFAPDGYLTTDLLGIIQEANWSAAQLLCVERQNLVGQTLFKYVNPSEVPAFSQHLTKLRSSHQRQTWESTLKPGQGNPFTVEITVVAVEDERKEVVGMRWLIRDITKRKQIELALRDSDERLRAALEASRMGTWDWNIQTGVIQWSDNLESLFGLEPGEFDGSYEMFASCLHPNDRDRVQAAIQHSIDTGEEYDIEFRVVYPNGNIRWALSRGKIFYDQDGQAIRMAGNDIDITERKRVEAELQESEERFRQLAENIDAAFWLKEISENRVSYVSPAYERLWDLNPQELYDNQQTWIDYIHPDDREVTDRAFREKAELGQFDEEYRIVLADGSVRWVHDRCFPLLNDSGEIYRFTGIAEDITERKRSEQALQENEELFRTSVENMLDCFAIYRAIRNEQGEIVDFQAEYINNAACLVSQIPREQHLSRRLCELLPGHINMGLFEEYCQVVETGQPLVKDSLIYQDNFGEQRLTKAFDIRVAKFGDGYIATWRDITNRKQTEEALRKNEQLLRLALAGAQAGSWDWEIPTGKVAWSPENYALYGIEPVTCSVQYETWYNALHPEDREQTNAEVLRVVEQGLPELRIEFRIINPERGVRWLLGLGRLILDDQGNPLRLSGINLDISERKQAEEELRQSEEFKRRILESSTDCIKLLDIDGLLLYMNSGGICLLEIDDIDSYINTDWTSFWQGDERTAAEIALIRAKQGETSRFQGFCVTAKGTPKWWDVVITPIFNSDEQVTQVLVASRDITNQKQAEEELRQSEERYRYLAETIPQLVWTCDARGSCDYVNQRLCDYTGFSFEQAIGQGWLLAVHPDDRQTSQALWIDAVRQSTYYRDEYRFRRASDGSYRWHLVLGLPVKDTRGGVLKWFGTCTDINEQKELEIERDRLLDLEQTARAEAERANRIKDEFLAILSHELRSPLNPILGWAQLLQTQKLDPATAAQGLATIERNAKLQTQLIDDLLDVAKILRGKLSLNAVPLNLVFVIEAALDTVRTAAVAKSILLYPILPNIGQVSADPTRLQQIVWNLLSNAIKFTPEGGRVDIRLERVDHLAQITISDTGKGINPDFLPHIFEYFRQEDVSITRKHGGLGLGLAIVRHLVEAHGGTISASSLGEGQGATFTVKLALLNVESETEETNDFLEGESDLTGIRVLCVDDEPDTLDLLGLILTQYGASVMTVGSAAEVFSTIESFQPDILVSDIGMPEVDGYTLLQQVRSLSPERGGQIRAIALTAYAGEIDQQRALSVGFQRHLTKPIEPNWLAQAVLTLVTDKRAT
jgi:PAS domain S-box-containing protein